MRFETMHDTLISFVRSRPELKARLKRILKFVGYDTTDWLRVVMYRDCFSFVRGLGPEKLDALEISAGPQWIREFTFGSYTGTVYPDFDICSERLSRQFDLIIADQVFEHLRWPGRAARNVYSMLKPGGHFVITVPFLVRMHGSPIDCSRWTEQGLFYFLCECGFPEDGITTASWGNRACVKANLTSWRKLGPFSSLAHEPNFPVMVWAFARRMDDDDLGEASKLEI